jgi:DDE superfamily endonuclease
MAQRKRQSGRPQPRHKKSQASRHDKRARLGRPNRQRRHTTRAKIPLCGALSAAVGAIAAVLDRRIAFRLAIIVAGMMLADDRRTASAWFVAAGVQDDWDRFYDCLISIGRKSRQIATVVLGLVVMKLAPGPGGRIRVGLDDSPTQRYGRHVEGAGVHHHPSPGPADGEWLYGHNWVALAWLATHPLWGVIALPLRSLLYVRQIDVPPLAAKYGWEFRTKHQLAAELISWFVATIRPLGILAQVWIVVDGAYAARPFLDPVLGQERTSRAGTTQPQHCPRNSSGRGTE